MIGHHSLQKKSYYFLGGGFSREERLRKRGKDPNGLRGARTSKEGPKIEYDPAWKDLANRV